MSWMVVMGIGAVLGLAALGAIVWALRKVPAPKKWGVLVAALIVGAGGAFMVLNATAIAGPTDLEEEVEEMEDFDAPLDDDWGDDWGDEEGGEGDNDWADEAEGAGDDVAEEAEGAGDDVAEGADEAATEAEEAIE